MQISELILKTNSINRTKLFYHKTLELDVLEESTEAISFKAGKTRLRFELMENEKPYYHFAFNITNNKFSDSFEWINQKLDILIAANELPIAVYNEWNAESFYFYDNNHNILEFIVRFDLPYYSAEAFSCKDIIEISEAGIAVDDVTAYAKMLHEKYNIPFFKKSKALPDFTVMGDDTGLLILSKTGRNWVPTHRPALVFPITIKAETGIEIEL